MEHKYRVRNSSNKKSTKDNNQECLTSQNSLSDMTPKLNLLDNKEVKKLIQSQYKQQENAILWPTKLAIHFEQGLTPTERTHSQTFTQKMHK